MEGFMDVIAAYRAGIENAVASMGTALTAELGYIMPQTYVPHPYMAGLYLSLKCFTLKILFYWLVNANVKIQYILVLDHVHFFYINYIICI